MNKISINIAIFLSVIPVLVSAQMMYDSNVPDDHTKQEEAEGREVLGKLQDKTLSCENLSEHDFGSLGEYYMGTMTGESHTAMNAMITRMHGEEGEEQIHVAIGKRLSGCDTSAAIPGGDFGSMPIMNMMGGWSDPSGFKNNFNKHMMNYGYSMSYGGGLGFLFMVFVWIILIVSTAGVVRWVFGGGRWQEHGSALSILKERYAKGEIDKKEFEEKKRELA